VVGGKGDPGTVRSSCARPTGIGLAALLGAVLVLVSACALAEGRGTGPKGPLKQQSRVWVPPFGGPTVKDSSGHNHHGLVRGDTVRGLPGHQRTAYGFDEPGSWVEIFPDPSLDPGSGDFVVSAWVNATHPPRGHNTFDVFRQGLSFTETGSYKLELVSNGRVRCTAKDTERRKARITSPQTGLADGTWHQIGCARVGSTWSVVVDGVATSKDATLGVIESDLSLSIGSKYGAEDFLDGALDDVRLVIDPVSTAPVQDQNVAEGLTRLEGIRPAGHWLLDEGR